VKWLRHRKERARYAEQVRWGLDYIRRVYGPQPTSAYEWGGSLPPGLTQVRNDTGKPERVVSLSIRTDSEFERWVVAWLKKAIGPDGDDGSR
jgi:hypothetical protein